MKVFLFEALWLMFLLRLPGLAWCVVQESRFHAVCGSAASALSPLPCASECAQDPLCAGFAMSPCELLLNISCTEGKETFEKQVPSTQGPSTQEPPTEGPSTQAPPNPCPAPFLYAAAVHSCYSFHPTTRETPVDDHQSKLCENLHGDAHLIAVETAAEQAYIPSIPGNDGSCRYMLSGAWMEKPHSGDITRWKWDLGGSRVSMTFMAWKTEQPDNENELEKHMVMDRDQNYEWSDILSDISLSEEFANDTMCVMCEYDPQ